MVLGINHPFLKLSQEMAGLCKPLELLGIHHFTYFKQFRSGHKISLSNKPRWIEDYYHLKLYQSSLYEKNLEHYQASFDVFFGDYDLEVYQHGKLYYNTMHSISIIEPLFDSCEFFLFSTTPDNANAIHFLDNNREILYHFILYLKDRGFSLLANAEKNKIIIPDKKIHLPEILNHKHHDMEILKKQFFQKTPIHKYQLEKDKKHHTKLTQREMDCIFHLLHHKTAAETGKEMNISRRTVESYIENIKAKLNCKDKMEIIKKFKDNKYLLALR